MNNRNNYHSCILVGFDPDWLRFYTFHGADWGDEGHFKVTNAGMLGIRFIDVFSIAEAGLG
jgi:hypothetical protein